MKSSCGRFVIVAAVAFTAATVAAERPAIRTYTVADGLAGDQVACLKQDRNGYLWVGTRTGLSRFDGTGFRSFDEHTGLPAGSTWEIAEGPGGTLRFLVGGDLFELAEDVADLGSFATVASAPAGAGTMAVDRGGGWWLGVGERLYRAPPGARSDFEPVELGIAGSPDRPLVVTALVAARDGGVWVGTTAGAHRVTASGAVAHYPVFVAGSPAKVSAILEDAGGRVWLAGAGVVVMRPDPVGCPAGFDLDPRATPGLVEGHTALPARPGEVRLLGAAEGLPTVSLFELDEAPDGSVWVVTYFGLFVVRDDGIEMRSRGTGLVSDHLSTTLLDRDGNRWLGTQSHGLMRINATGFSSFTEADGLADRKLSSVTLAPGGRVVAVGFPPEGYLNILRGDRFEPVRLPLPADWLRRGWGLNQVTFFDHLGALWVPTGYGLVRFPPVPDPAEIATASPAARYTSADGLGGDVVFRLWEDSRGDLWIGLLDVPGVVHWRRRDGSFNHRGAADGLPSSTATAFAEDAAGDVWVGFLGGGVARFSRHGTVESFSSSGLPRGFVNCLLADSGGRLWVGAQHGGLGWSDNPTAARPSWHTLGIGGGLAAEGVFSLTEDSSGQVWIGSLKGVDRLDPDSGRLDHFDTSTGLVNNLVLDALTGPGGDVWFATDGGVSRVRPFPATPRRPPPVLLDRVSLDGRPVALPIRGTATLAPIELPAGSHSIEIGFTAVDMVPGSRLGFAWTVNDGPAQPIGPREPRVLRLAGLEAGRREIRIRSTLPDGSVGAAASLTVQIAPPFWRRTWFLMTLALVVIVAAAAAHRVRLARLQELHRVRGRIAADLHDEMGLSLTRVAMLADVVRGSLGSEHSEVGGALEEIGGSARTLVDAASDMAWALDPRHDTATAVMARVRKQAADVVEGAGARLVWQVDDLDGLAMSSEQRRHLLLILKEAIHNACRHGRPRTVEVAVERTDGQLAIAVADDGCGFDPAAQGDVGQGLGSMQQRATALGGDLQLRTAPGTGTSVSLELDLAAGRIGMRWSFARWRAKLRGR